MKLVIAALINYFLFSCLVSHAGNIAAQVSIYELLANPNEFVGKKVFVKGFLGDGGSRAGIFPNEQDAKISNLAARVYIDESDDRTKLLNECKWVYVAISGVFQFDYKTGVKSFSDILTVRAFGDVNTETGVTESRPCFYKK